MNRKDCRICGSPFWNVSSVCFHHLHVTKIHAAQRFSDMPLIRRGCSGRIGTAVNHKGGYYEYSEETL